MKRYIAKGRPDSALKAAKRLGLKNPRKVVAFVKQVVREALLSVRQDAILPK